MTAERGLRDILRILLLYITLEQATSTEALEGYAHISGAAMKGQPRREGPARARALAQKGGSGQGSESATAWLKGSHAAIAMHPEWQKARLIVALIHCSDVGTPRTGI